MRKGEGTTNDKEGFSDPLSKALRFVYSVVAQVDESELIPCESETDDDNDSRYIEKRYGVPATQETEGSPYQHRKKKCIAVNSPSNKIPHFGLSDDPPSPVSDDGPVVSVSEGCAKPDSSDDSCLVTLSSERSEGFEAWRQLERLGAAVPREEPNQIESILDESLDPHPPDDSDLMETLVSILTQLSQPSEKNCFPIRAEDRVEIPVKFPNEILTALRDPPSVTTKIIQHFLDGDLESAPTTPRGKEVSIPMLPPALAGPTLTPLREKDAFVRSTPPLPGGRREASRLARRTPPQQTRLAKRTPRVEINRPQPLEEPREPLSRVKVMVEPINEESDDDTPCVFISPLPIPQDPVFESPEEESPSVIPTPLSPLMSPEPSPPPTKASDTSVQHTPDTERVTDPSLDKENSVPTQQTHQSVEVSVLNEMLDRAEEVMDCTDTHSVCVEPSASQLPSPAGPVSPSPVSPSPVSDEPVPPPDPVSVDPVSIDMPHSPDLPALIPDPVEAEVPQVTSAVEDSPLKVSKNVKRGSKARAKAKVVRGRQTKRAASLESGASIVPECPESHRADSASAGLEMSVSPVAWKTPRPITAVPDVPIVIEDDSVPNPPEEIVRDPVELVEEIMSTRAGLASCGVQATVKRDRKKGVVLKRPDAPFGEAPLKRVSILERPKRLRLPPLQWWRNERIEYEQDETGQGFRARAVYLIDSKEKADKAQVSKAVKAPRPKGKAVAKKRTGRKPLPMNEEDPQPSPSVINPSLIPVSTFFDKESKWLDDISAIPAKPVLTEDVAETGETIVRCCRSRNTEWVDIQSGHQTGYKVKLLSKTSRIQHCFMQLNGGQTKGMDETQDCRFALCVMQCDPQRLVVTMVGALAEQDVSLNVGDWLFIPPKMKYNIVNQSRSKVANISMYICVPVNGD
eukprot:Blabericola_migrator_1__98@NODE_1024_length_5666_cov_136_591534_g704_i0_p1_GENE_NODE_1024_length_5666_cov_136_591534_g704_i0NODE_1024_length_5666_cov_136_591534_g704_i0_p1_ORF_typecomplete_len913_score209_36CENPC_C/PF11699_8/0_0028_NODE_1024_length_5666_cov_136_591534_g704_i0472785